MSSSTWQTRTADAEPGRLAAAVQRVASLPPLEFRSRLTKVGAVFGAMLIANAAIGASSLGRSARAIVSAPVGLGLTVAGLAGATLLLGRFGAIDVRRFRVLALVSAVLLAAIIATGAAVRLTGSGLGCPDWPTCEGGSVLPSSGRSGQIEFGNRIVTGLCILAAGVCALAALTRRPYRRDLATLGALVCALIFGNAIVGGIVVIFHLKSGIVAAHFILAIAALSAALTLFHRSAEPGPSDLWGRDRTPRHGSKPVLAARVATGVLLIGLILGTVATGSGPHSGDPAKTERFPFGIEAAARVHSIAMWCALASIVWLAAACVSVGATEPRRRITWLLAAVVAQGGLGYFQYAKQLPAGLVQLHVIGATVVWTLLVWVRASLTTPPTTAH